eukprot:1157830-Pelagomonas_calceolata.AAC.2
MRHQHAYVALISELPLGTQSSPLPKPRLPSADKALCSCNGHGAADVSFAGMDIVATGTPMKTCTGQSLSLSLLQARAHHEGSHFPGEGWSLLQQKGRGASASALVQGVGCLFPAFLQCIALPVLRVSNLFIASELAFWFGQEYPRKPCDASFSVGTVIAGYQGGHQASTCGLRACCNSDPHTKLSPCRRKVSTSR